uniref:acetate--CoA ligase n=1 Tax=Petromyzon marinus TaxID=7757 RepID=S4RKV6_PETMA
NTTCVIKYHLPQQVCEATWVGFVFVHREGNEPGDCNQITYKELLDQVCKCSNVLLSHGVGKGDRVAIYMPMITELVVAMLACARVGAVHSIVVSSRAA